MLIHGFALPLLFCLAAPATSLDAALHRIYSFDFATGQAMASQAAAHAPEDPLAPAVLASAYLFAELDRLRLLDGGKMQGRPDPAVRQAMEKAAALAQRRAEAKLAGHPGDADGLTSLMLIHGVRRDYLALVDKSYRASWEDARRAHEYAQQLRRLHPDRADAFFTLGFTDYLISTAPFFVRPLMKMPGAEGNRQRGIGNLERAANEGRFLKGFARILLVGIYRKEGRAQDARRLLRELAQEYPINRTIQRELSRSEAGDSGL